MRNNWCACLIFFDTVEVKSSADGFMIKMRDGRHLRCAHNNPHGGHLPDYAPHPAIVLKMEDGTGLLLPIIVCMFPFHFFLSKIGMCSFSLFMINILRFILTFFFRLQITCFLLQWRCQVHCSWQPCAASKLYASLKLVCCQLMFWIYCKCFNSNLEFVIFLY